MTAGPGVGDLSRSTTHDPVLLLCAHGSRARSAQVATEEIASAVSAALPATDVVLTWVDVQEPDVVARCEEFADRPVVVVPLLLAAGYHVRKDLAEAVADRPHHVVTTALGPHRGLSEVMARRIRHAEAEHDDDAPAPDLVLVAAGSSDERAVADVHRQAEDLAELTGRPVRTGFVSAVEPKAHRAVAEAWRDGAHHVTTVSFHVAPGMFHRDATDAATTPVDGASSPHATTGGRVTDPLLVDGTDVPPEVVAVVIDRWEEGRAALADLGH